MKANGKNLKMFMYTTHYYMDMRPNVEFRTAESQEVIDQILNGFRERWNSGTVSSAHEVTPMEFYMARCSAYWHGYKHQLDNLACDCTKEWVKEYDSLVHSTEPINF